MNRPDLRDVNQEIAEYQRLGFQIVTVLRPDLVVPKTPDLSTMNQAEFRGHPETLAHPQTVHVEMIPLGVYLHAR